MTINTMSLVSPTPNRKFIWYARYIDGAYLYEFQNNSFTNFNEIDKNKLIDFGLIGLNMKMNYDVLNGKFDIHGRKIDLAYEDDNGNIYKLTNANDDINIKYNDCISYKSVEKVIVGFNQGMSTITGYHYGYKVKLNDFTFKALVHIPYQGKVTLETYLVSNEDLNGKLLIIKNNQILEKIEMNLQKNIGKSMEWVVK